MTDMIVDVRKYMRRDNVTFAELSRRIEGFEGEGAIGPEGNPNVVYWTGMSAEASKCVSTLLREGFCHLHIAEMYQTTIPLVYLIDGVMLSLPLVKANRQYKTPHWLPVVFKMGPSCRAKHCPSRKES